MTSRSGQIRLAPSILAADFSALGRDIEAATRGGADQVHVDVMDGHFVPNITIGVPVVKSLRKATTLPLDIALIAVLTGLAEEPGWRGYAQPTANLRYRPLIAALVVSLIWAGWHLPNALFGQTLTDTATHFLATVVNGFVLAWAYNSTGSVLVVMLLHGAQNASNGLIRALFDGATATPTPTRPERRFPE